MNALIAVLFVLIGTGMGRDAGLFLWVVLATVEWLRCLAMQNIVERPKLHRRASDRGSCLIG